MATYASTDAAMAAPPGAEATSAALAGSAQSAVSWGAIFAGAAVAAALSLVLLVLGTGLGMSSVSPWQGQGIGTDKLGWASVAWLTFTALAASGVGGYVAGRLRTKWTGIHTHEMFFRDTAHGLLAWAVATLFSAALLSSVVGTIVGTGVKAGAALAGNAASTAISAATSGATGAGQSSGDTSGSMNYLVDSLFRTSPGGAMVSPMPAPTGDSPATAREVATIFANALQTGTLPPEDSQYLAQVVAQRTGLTPEQAQKRVNDTFAKAKAQLADAKAKAKSAADAARKATAYASLWIVVSLLLGAFIASLAATWGGRQRDL